MVREIIWSPLAVETFDNILDYLDENFGEKSVKDFLQRVDAKLKLIQDQGCLGEVVGNQIRTSQLSGAKPRLPTGIEKLKTKLNLSFFGECKTLLLNQNNTHAFVYK